MHVTINPQSKQAIETERREKEPGIAKDRKYRVGETKMRKKNFMDKTKIS